MKKILFLFFTVCMLQYAAIGQSDVVYLYDNTAGLVTTPYPPGTIPPWYSNLEKYWFYRYRLVNDFLKIGEKAGESLPAFNRSRSDKQGHWADLERGYYCNPAGDNDNEKNMLSWGTDGTCALGHYITALATEYKQMQDFNMPTKRTLYELKYAQNALNRLCNNAAYYEHNTCIYICQ